MNASLVHVRSDGRQREIPLNHPVTLVGRRTDCQLRIPISSVSRRHCELRMADGGLYLRDLGSSNGTFVNGHRLQGEAELTPGDLVSIGSLVFVVRLDGHPRAIDASEAARRGKPAQAPGTAPSAIQSGFASPSAGDSSIDFDFDLDLDDDEDEQPSL